MANGNAASSTRKRLTKKQPSKGQLAKEPERPEVGLARNLIRTEYGLSNWSRRLSERIDRAERAWADLTDELSRLVDRITGRSRSTSSAAPEEGAPSPVGGQAADPSVHAAPQQPPPSQEQFAPGGREGFEAMIDQLPPPERKAFREAFEDAVLEQLNSEKKWQKAYDKSPASMPTVAEYANNAYMRKALRETSPGVDPPQQQERRAAYGDVSRTVTPTEPNAEAELVARRARWERLGTDPPRTSMPSTGTSFQNPREEVMSDGIAFQEAARATAAWATESSRNPAQHPMSDGHAFQAIENARRERVTASTPSPTNQVTDPVLDAERAMQGWGTQNSRMNPVSPLLESSSPAFPPVPPLLSDLGHQVLHDQLASQRGQGSSAASGAGTTSHSSTTPSVPTRTPSQSSRRSVSR